jgi:hypothetical protein
MSLAVKQAKFALYGNCGEIDLPPRCVSSKPAAHPFRVRAPYYAQVSAPTVDEAFRLTGKNGDVETI